MDRRAASARHQALAALQITCGVLGVPPALAVTSTAFAVATIFLLEWRLLEKDRYGTQTSMNNQPGGEGRIPGQMLALFIHSALCADAQVLFPTTWNSCRILVQAAKRQGCFILRDLVSFVTS